MIIAVQSDRPSLVLLAVDVPQATELWLTAGSR